MEKVIRLSLRGNDDDGSGNDDGNCQDLVTHILPGCNLHRFFNRTDGRTDDQPDGQAYGQEDGPTDLTNWKLL